MQTALHTLGISTLRLTQFLSDTKVGGVTRLAHRALSVPYQKRSLTEQSGQRSIFARSGYDVNDPEQTSLPFIALSAAFLL